MTDELLQNAIVVITGARGVGKSTLALTYYDPDQALLDRVFVHDSERSDNRIIQQMEEAQLKFGYYGDLNTRFSNLPSSNDLLHRINRGDLPWVSGKEKGALRGYYEYVVADLDKNLEQGKYDVYVHDTLEKLEGGMAAWVEDNIKMFGYDSLRKARQQGRIWSDATYSLYEQLTNAVFSRGVKVIILTSHLKTPWQDGKPVPGKVSPGGKKLLYRLSSLMLWLVNEPTNLDSAPAGLVLKERLGKMSVVGGKWRVERMIPERIPHCTWDDIKDYLANGCDLSNPSLRMKDAEKGMISELLTDAQMRLMILSAEERLKNDHDVQPAPTFAVPTPEYRRAQDRAGELRSSGEPITEGSLLAAFAPPLRGKTAVREAVAKVLGEL